jgi:hypothetical protein
MTWSKFTKDNIKIFKTCKYTLKSNNILYKSIRNKRDDIKLFIRQNKIYYNITKLENLDKYKSKINSYSDAYFVDRKNVIKELKNLSVIYEIKWDNNIIIIQTTDNDFINIRKRLRIIIYMIEYLKKMSEYSDNIYIYLVLTKLNKKFSTNHIMDVENANSGYTNINDNENYIFIWRYEEFEKVLFHELMHLFNLDTRNHMFDNHINIKGETSYFEAITDFWGIFYYIIFISLITKVQIKLLLELELGFIRNQAMQLNNLLMLKDWQVKPNKIITQKTAAFSYYIIKYLLFEYALIHSLYDYNIDPNTLINKVLKIGFKTIPYKKIDSARMTLLQLL